MKATFVELPAFDRLRATYLDDDEFAALQHLLMKHPNAGIQIPGPAAFVSFASVTGDGTKARAAASG